jgi:hypothetical protein
MQYLIRNELRAWSVVWIYEQAQSNRACNFFPFLPYLGVLCELQLVFIKCFLVFINETSCYLYLRLYFSYRSSQSSLTNNFTSVLDLKVSFGILRVTDWSYFDVWSTSLSPAMMYSTFSRAIAISFMSVRSDNSVHTICTSWKNE